MEDVRTRATSRGKNGKANMEESRGTSLFSVLFLRTSHSLDKLVILKNTEDSQGNKTLFVIMGVGDNQ